jgi:hypothetical protein
MDNRVSEYQQYQKFYRLLRIQGKSQALWEFANQFGMLDAYDNATASYTARNRKPKTLAERLDRYKSRKHLNDNMAYAA